MRASLQVIIACTAAVVAIALATFQKDGEPLLELVPGGLIASGIMMATGCMSGERARQSIKWDVYVTIAAAFGISNVGHLPEDLQAGFFFLKIAIEHSIGSC